MKELVAAALMCSLGMALSPCVHPAHEPAPPATRPVEPPAPPAPLRPCEAACTNTARLGCPYWGGTPGPDGVFGNVDDVSCERVCEDFEAVSKELPGVSLHPECVGRARDCDEVDHCFDG